MPKQTTSARLDSDVAAFVEEERIKRGMLKSSTHNSLLRELMNMKQGDIKLTDNSNKENPKKEMIKELENEVAKNEETIRKSELLRKDMKEKTYDLSGLSNQLKPEVKLDDIKVSIPPASQISLSDNSRIQLSDTKVLANPINDMSDLINITSSNKKSDTKDLINITSSNKKKPMEIRRMVTDETLQHDNRNSTSDEERFRKFLEKQKFNENIKDMYTKINKIDEMICKDGECTKRELENIKKDVSGLHKMKDDINSNLTEKLAGLTNLDKLIEIDNLKKDLGDIKSKLKKTDICPGCGYADVPHLASFCPDCGTEFHAWTNEDGSPVDWKPFKERNKK